VLVCVKWFPTHVLCFCVVFLRLVYPILLVSLGYSFLIAPSVFSNVYSRVNWSYSMQDHDDYFVHTSKLHIFTLYVQASQFRKLFPMNDTFWRRQFCFEIVGRKQIVSYKLNRCCHSHNYCVIVYWRVVQYIGVFTHYKWFFKFSYRVRKMSTT
jgi:hypothetical protein